MDFGAPGVDAMAAMRDTSRMDTQESEIPEIDRESDLIGVVVPGDSDGLSFLVVRSLGYGDSGFYSGGPVERVTSLQQEAGLDPDGVVRGATWALVLRETPVAQLHGHEMYIVRRLLGLRGLASTNEIRDALRAFTESDVVTRDVWKGLIETAMIESSEGGLEFTTPDGQHEDAGESTDAADSGEVVVPEGTEAILFAQQLVDLRDAGFPEDPKDPDGSKLGKA